MAKTLDTARLDFLIENGGHLSDNQGHGYIYWYPNHSGRTKIVEGRTAREALDAAMRGEKGQ